MFGSGKGAGLVDGVFGLADGRGFRESGRHGTGAGDAAERMNHGRIIDGSLRNGARRQVFGYLVSINY